MPQQLRADSASGLAQAHSSTLHALLWAEMIVRVAKPQTLGLWIGVMADAGTCFQEDIVTDRGLTHGAVHHGGPFVRTSFSLCSWPY